MCVQRDMLSKVTQEGDIRDLNEIQTTVQVAQDILL